MESKGTSASVITRREMKAKAVAGAEVQKGRFGRKIIILSRTLGCRVLIRVYIYFRLNIIGHEENMHPAFLGKISLE